MSEHRNRKFVYFIFAVILALCVGAIPLALQQRSYAQGAKTKSQKTASGSAAKSANGVDAKSWPVFGRDVMGSHHNPEESAITPQNVAQLKTKWIFQTEGDVSSQPVIVNGVLYFGSWDGKEYAIDAKTGKKIWEYDCGQSSRNGASYGNGALFFSDMAGYLHALDAKTGALKWKKRIDSHPDTVGTSSPIYHDGRVYIGVASHEEGWILKNPKYECCTFRGSVVAFDAATAMKPGVFTSSRTRRRSRARTKRAEPSSAPRAARSGQP
jgi:outer membrane protein assembly factor BamB